MGTKEGKAKRNCRQGLGLGEREGAVDGEMRLRIYDV